MIFYLIKQFTQRKHHAEKQLPAAGPHRISKLHARFVKFMSKQEQRLTVFQKKMSLFVFLLITGSFFFVLLYRGITYSARPGVSRISFSSKTPEAILPLRADTVSMKKIIRQLSDSIQKQTKTYDSAKNIR